MCINGIWNQYFMNVAECKSFRLKSVLFVTQMQLFLFVKTNQFSVHSATVILCLEKQGLIPSPWFWIEIIQKIVEYFSRFTDSMKNRECSLSQNVWLYVTADFCHNISDYWIFLSDWWPAPAPAPSCWLRKYIAMPLCCNYCQI